MILRCQNKVPMSMAEIGIAKLLPGEYWAVHDATIAKAYAEIAGSSISDPLDRAKRAGILAVNPDIPLPGQKSVMIKSTFLVAYPTIYIVDPIAHTHHFFDVGVIDYYSDELNRLIVLNQTSSDLIIHVRV